MDSNSSSFKLSVMHLISRGRTRPLLRTDLRRTICWLFFALLVTAMLPLSIAAQSPEPDPRTAGSGIVGKLLPVRSPTGMVRIPAEHQQIMEANIQRFVTIVLRNPALRPPVGFDFRTGTHLYAPPLPVSPHPPLAYTMTGLFYWYTYMPGYRKIRPEVLAMQGFFLRANDISTVFNGLERWPVDKQGLTYYEPREIRKVAGYTQYSSGVIVIKRNPRPIWVPVSREWALQQELAQMRKNFDSIAEDAKAAEAYNPKAILEKWLEERPERQQEMEKSYSEMKQSYSEYAEKIRANFFDTEKRTEKTMREIAERQEAETPRYRADFAKELSTEKNCIHYLEGELARLSPDERTAPAYISLNPDRKQSSPELDCSCIVDADSTDVIRIVKENPDYYDKTLPPSTIQLILVDFSYFEGSVRVSPPWRHAVYERFRDGLDYSALAAMLQK